MRKALSISYFGCAAGLMVASATSSTEPEVQWVAPPGCPSSAAISEEIDRLVSPDARSSSRVRAKGTVSGEARRWRVRIETNIDGVMGKREIEADSCAAVARAFALVVALAMDPERAFLEPDEPSEPSEPEGKLEEKVDEKPDKSMPESQDFPAPIPLEAHPRWLIDIETLLGAGSLPSLGPGVGIGAGLKLSPWRWVMEGRYWLPRDGTADDTAGASVQLATVGGQLCLGHRSGLEGCGGIEGGKMWARGFGVDVPQKASFTWFAFLFGPTLRWQITTAFELGLGLEASIPLSRPTFFLEGIGSAHRPGAIGVRGALSTQLVF